MIEIRAQDFATAERAARCAAARKRSQAAAQALERLHLAREAFAQHAEEIYSAGAEAAARDADRLELVADRLLQLVQAQQVELDRLEVARDVALYQGPTLTRLRSRFDIAAAAERMAEALAEDLLSAPAQAVLTAAVRRRTA